MNKSINKYKTNDTFVLQIFQAYARCVQTLKHVYVCVRLKGRPWKPDEIALILVGRESVCVGGGDKAVLVAARPSQDQAGTSRGQQTMLSCFPCVSRLMPHQDTADPAA